MFNTTSLHHKAVRDVAVQRRFASWPPPEKFLKCFAEQARLRILWISPVVLNNYKKSLIHSLNQAMHETNSQIRGATHIIQMDPSSHTNICAAW